jgi:hypothetical protein
VRWQESEENGVAKCKWNNCLEAHLQMHVLPSPHLAACEEHDSNVSINRMGFRHIVKAGTALMKSGMSQDNHSHATTIEDKHDKK